MKKRTLSMILQAPAILLLVVSFIGSIYAKIKMPTLINSWGPAVILAIILGLYFWGRSMENKSDGF
jgi:hypothetical protein